MCECTVIFFPVKGTKPLQIAEEKEKKLLFETYQRT